MLGRIPPDKIYLSRLGSLAKHEEHEVSVKEKILKYCLLLIIALVDVVDGLYRLASKCSCFQSETKAPLKA